MSPRQVQTSMQAPSLSQGEGYWIGRFSAMASPCELLMEQVDESEAQQLLSLAYDETRRIEEKFSRYRRHNIVDQINRSNAKPLKLDEETARLIDYAQQCYQISDGMFDITSGVLREVWQFDGSDRVPEQADITPLLSRIGWDKVSWDGETLILAQGMEIDLGGIGKEYAVDRSAQLLMQHHAVSMLINYGGDLFSTRARENGHGWIIGIEDPLHQQKVGASSGGFELRQGGIATSGDTRRYLLKEGRRYGHILNPKTGWPVEGAPRSITVHAPSCTEAGVLSTLAMLQGGQAETFLQQQELRYWIVP